jgi:hypothetical protein
MHSLFRSLVDFISKIQQDTIAFPLRFSSIEEEINAICLIDVLNFGSGYRYELHRTLKRVRYHLSISTPSIQK